MALVTGASVGINGAKSSHLVNNFGINVIGCGRNMVIVKKKHLSFLFYFELTILTNLILSYYFLLLI